MMELAAMKRSDIQQIEDRTTIHTKVRKGKKIKEFNIKFLKRNDVCCAHEDLKLWLMDSQLWKDLGCSSELKELIGQVGVDDVFGGNMIRHLMMTMLRQDGASLELVNEFTSHAPVSSIVYRFCNKLEKADDLGSLLLKE
ncbi:MAG: hypothetical protein EZS28_036412 [Streblomastix strix]|uniref:Tyr recombinase domain-containing protein n=1 Tax=Streblomastix strix TaxID=222440 RepID=A0A5J4UDQ3_9EUKA|nr:MAG: hypothetical protein EZS28_036412 [Streblomastix strix]